MAEPELTQQIKHFQHELGKAEAEAKQAIRRVDYLRQVVNGLLGLSQTADPEPTPSLFPITTVPIPESPARTVDEANVPNGREAVRRVLIETRRAWKIPDLAAEIQRRGWMPGVASPRDATAASTQRLYHDGEVERVGFGVYRYALDKLPPPQEEQPHPHEALEVLGD